MFFSNTLCLYGYCFCTYVLLIIGLLVFCCRRLPSPARCRHSVSQAVGKDCIWMLQLVFLIIKLDGDVRNVAVGVDLESGNL